MKLIKLSISPDELRMVSPTELFFFTQITLFLNEILILEKIINFALNSDDKDNETLRKAHLTQVIFLSKILAGKLFEGWELLQKKFFGAGLSQDYYPQLTPETKECLDQIKRYFSKANAISQIRKNFAFHYSTKDDELQKQITQLTTQLPDAQPLELYMAEYEGNCLYVLSHSLINYLMFSNSYGQDIAAALRAFNSEVHQVVKWFVAFSQHIVLMFTQKYRWSFIEIDIPDPPGHLDIWLPYFIGKDTPPS